jgi:hypothetical protein
MTAVRNFPNSPLRRQATPLRWQTPAWLVRAWEALQRAGQLRAARELELYATHRQAYDPEMAAQLRQAAAECRRPPQAASSIERSKS